MEYVFVSFLPLFIHFCLYVYPVTWLEEWEEQVTLKPNSSKYQVEAIAKVCVLLFFLSFLYIDMLSHKAIRALKQCPVTFKDPQDAQQLKVNNCITGSCLPIMIND